MHRMIDTATWDDPWFADLNPNSKLAFLYLLTNRRSTAAGAFEITLRQMAFETGLDVSCVGPILESMAPRVMWWPAHQIVWVRNFFRHQAANDNFTKSAQKCVLDLPADVQAAIGSVYPILFPDGPPQPQPTNPEPLARGMDTPSEHLTDPSPSNSNRESKSNRGEEGEKTDARKRAPVDESHPFALLESLCDVLGQDVSVLSKNEKGKQLSVAKRLIEAGMTPRDVEMMTLWLKSQSWVTGGIDLFFLERQLGKWQLAGKPATAPNGSLTVHQGGRNGQIGRDGRTDAERGYRLDPGPKGWSADELARMSMDDYRTERSGT